MVKYTIEYIKNRTQELVNGYTCISNVYSGSKSKLYFMCDKGHTFSTTWENFRIWKNCNICNSNKRLELKYVKEKTKKLAEGYECISNIYINNSTKLKFKCSKNHIFYMAWSNFSTGKRCRVCNSYTIEEIKKIVNKLNIGYTCLSKEYLGTHSKLEFKCDKEHIYKVTWSNFQKGSRCSICFKIRNKKDTHACWKGGKKVAWYDTYAHQISFCEEVRRDPKNRNYLQVKCTESSCRKWFKPKHTEVCSRLIAINKGNAGNRFYCSDKCKHNCSIFKQKDYPKGFINTDNNRQDQSDWSNMIKERDNFECQKCGATDNLVAHHIEGLNVNPLESVDVDIGITLCIDCHKEAHDNIGCKTSDLTKRSLCNEKR